MLKFSGKTVYFLFLMFAFTSHSIAANLSNYKVQHIYSKIQFFDSLNIQDSLFHYVKLGYSECSKIDLNSVDSKDIQLVIAEIYYHYGDMNYISNDVFESINGFENAAKIFKKYDVKDKYSDCIFELATNFSKVGEAPKSLQLMHEATSIFIDLKDTAGIIAGYRSIGLLYNRQRDYVRGREYLIKALKLSKNTDDIESSIHLYVALAVMYKKADDLEKTAEMYKEALRLAELTNVGLVRANVYSNLAEFYKNSGKLDQAKLYFDKANEIIEESDSDYKRSFLWLNYSDYYYLKEEYQQAVIYGEKALHLCEEIKNRRGEFITLNILLKIYEKIGNTDKLALYQKRVIAHLFEHKDELNAQINELETVRFKLDKQNLIIENEKIKSQFEKEQKEKEQNYIYIILFCVFAILKTIALVLYIRLRAIRKLNKYITKQSEERKLLLKEVHHRVKNNFQIVSSMLRLQSYGFENEILRQNFEEAVSRINAMAIVHNVIYRQEKFKDIDAKSYLEQLVDNLNKTGDSRIVVSIQSEEVPFKIETLINLGIALNELITNSFKHAFTDQMDQPKINISLRTIADKTYEIVYKDNGVGIDKQDYQANFGMDLIDTIISNFDGDVSITTMENWNTVIKITFKEF
ncbi:histidine kinase dimerization/phosphoacceptor domain -containing protein [Brumimicrobium mesophilum]|uniref:histidine kinase dimerization/phosphoacceptor domain -containing protein n=1 Tax=Brumimicrobium mesophilum TaxID=392717 RepID=UPI000D142F3E|nr:histidine kinase dimerization/phosphoacceptor domain -containing protein [Brumimicrobium mesophilum]